MGTDGEAGVWRGPRGVLGASPVHRLRRPRCDAASAGATEELRDGTKSLNSACTPYETRFAVCTPASDHRIPVGSSPDNVLKAEGVEGRDPNTNQHSAIRINTALTY